MNERDAAISGDEPFPQAMSRVLDAGAVAGRPVLEVRTEAPRRDLRAIDDRDANRGGRDDENDGENDSHALL
ncbi:MAG TPA: hypothetical protein VGL90_08185 [Casimicrobiaceae bacterium]